MDGTREARARASEDYERLQLRRIDALQFKLQREINIRDDEIARLKTDIALTRGKADTISHAVQQSENLLDSQRADLKKRLSEAKSQVELRRAVIEKEHQDAVKSLDEDHQAETVKLRARLRSALFDRDRPVPVDDVDAFLNAIRGPRAPTKDLSGKNRRDSIRSELKGIESMNERTEKQIQYLRRKLSALRKKLGARQRVFSEEPVGVELEEESRLVESDHGHGAEEEIGDSHVPASEAGAEEASEKYGSDTSERAESGQSSEGRPPRHKKGRAESQAERQRVSERLAEIRALQEEGEGPK
jgi:hypothetical protein